MAANSPNFYQGGGFQAYYQPSPLLPYGLPLLPQPLVSTNPWAAQCMPAPQYYQQQHQVPMSSMFNPRFNHQPMSRGRGRNRHRQNSNWRQKQNCETNTGQFSCETCECSFRAEFDLKGHISQHRQCSHPGCDFMAINRVLKEHELIHRIPEELLFTSEEDIAKWRQERRKKYPTMGRVKEKLLEEEAKMQRGETAKIDVHRYSKRGGARNGYPGANCGRGGRGKYKRRNPMPDRKGVEKVARTDESLSNDNSCSVNQLASSLAKDTEINTSLLEKPRAPILRGYTKHKATLLEKLLAPEIRRENNTVLQCIRHIVTKNFFGIETTGNVEITEEEQRSNVDVPSEDHSGNELVHVSGGSCEDVFSNLDTVCTNSSE